MEEITEKFAFYAAPGRPPVLAWIGCGPEGPVRAVYLDDRGETQDEEIESCWIGAKRPTMCDIRNFWRELRQGDIDSELRSRPGLREAFIDWRNRNR